MGTALDVQSTDSRMALLDSSQSYINSDQFTHREKIALRYCDALMTNPLNADDEMWAQLHEEFTEPELVALGYYIGFRIGVQRWIISFHPVHGEYAEALAQKKAAAAS